MTRAYNESYLSDAKDTLSQCFDYLINDCNFSADWTATLFLTSGYAELFERGNPGVIAGKSGVELAKSIVQKTYKSRALPELRYGDGLSAEYWAGWALAYYQWSTDLSFMEILRAASLDDIIQMYPFYHEMDLTHFEDHLDHLVKKAHPQKRLCERRKNCGMTQSELAAEADVPLRQIQLFEQGQRDINKTSAITLLKLSKALHCKMEDLLEPERA